MKVCIVIDYWFPSIGGGPMHVAELVRRLVRHKDVHLTVLTSNLFIGSDGKTPKEYQDIAVVRLGKRAQFGNIFGKLDFLIRCFFYLLNHDFDILHVHPYTPLLIAKLVGLIKKKPVVMTVHVMGNDMIGLPRIPFMSEFITSLDRFFTFGIVYDAQIFVDKQLMQGKSATHKRYFIPNGVDTKAFDVVKRKKNPFVQMLFVGRFHRQKNLPALLRAFSTISHHLPTVRLVLIGEGEEKGILQKIVKDNNLATVVKFLSPQFGKALIGIYKSSDLFILPSRYEGFPITLLEAWAAKLPVITTEYGMARELVKDGMNGFLIPSPQENDIAQTMSRALTYKNRKALGQLGYRLVQSRFNWEDAAEKIYGVYKTVLQKP